MILDGERIKALVAQAKSEVIIFAPFIKTVPLKLILGAVPNGVPVRVITRWRALEVALGVSDLEVFDVINDRENTELRLIDELHAKLFVADDKCLAGSANVTAAALGWSKTPNLELLLDAGRENPYIEALISRIQGAELATYQLRASVEEEAKQVSNPQIEDFLALDEDQLKAAVRPWLPKCAAPDKLFLVYKDPTANLMAGGTRDDASSDLLALLPPKNLTKSEFVSYIGETIQRLPAFQQVVSKVPERVNDAHGQRIISEIRSDLSSSECNKQWIIVRDWISIFLSERIEVAPESFVVRLKPH
jgi:hypothetical protein